MIARPRPLFSWIGIVWPALAIANIGGKTKKIKPKEQLLDLSKIKEHEGTIKVDCKIVGDSKKGEVKTIIRAKDFKVEIPKADDQADQFLSLYKKEPKLAAIIDDFNLEKINSKEDIANSIRKISSIP